MIFCRNGVWTVVFLSTDLDAVHPGIASAQGNQFRMGALLGDTAILDDQDLIGVTDGG